MGVMAGYYTVSSFATTLQKMRQQTGLIWTHPCLQLPLLPTVLAQALSVPTAYPVTTPQGTVLCIHYYLEL